MYIWLFIIPLLLVLGAQALVTGTYKKYKVVRNQKNVTGFDAARRILDAAGMKDVYIVETKGVMSDHYDPRKKVVRLSSEVYHGVSIASVSIAAHECGHAIQDKEGYAFMRVRGMMVPVVNIASKIGYFVLLVGLIASLFDLAFLGFILLSATLLFQLVTLPVEFDASTKARKWLVDENLILDDEVTKVKSMLGAAAMTYVASLLANLIEMIRLYLILTRRN